VRTFSLEVLDMIEQPHAANHRAHLQPPLTWQCEFAVHAQLPTHHQLSAKEAEFARRVMASIVGEDNVRRARAHHGRRRLCRTCCMAKPGCYSFIANGDGTHREMGHGGGPCMLHNPSYDFNDDLIPLGATYWVRLAETGSSHRLSSMPMTQPDAFSDSYAQARAKFLAAAASAGLAVQSNSHPLPGRDGEALATDVVLRRPGRCAAIADRHQRLLMALKAFAAAACRSMRWATPTGGPRRRASGVAVLYVHALNPHGFSYQRRVTHENVDLNRNFHDFAQPLPVNEAYRALHALVLPEHWPPDAANQAAVAAYIAGHGMGAFQGAITRGQHEFADGLFSAAPRPPGATRPSGKSCASMPSRAPPGLGGPAHRLGAQRRGRAHFACRDDAAALARARQWWGGGGATPVTSIYDGSSSSAFLTGLMWIAAYQEVPAGRVHRTGAEVRHPADCRHAARPCAPTTGCTSTHRRQRRWPRKFTSR